MKSIRDSLRGMLLEADETVSMHDPMIVIEDWLKKHSTTKQAWDSVYSVNRAVADRLYKIYDSAFKHSAQRDKLEVSRAEAKEYAKLFRDYKKGLGKYGGSPSQLASFKQAAQDIIDEIEYVLK